MSKEKRILLVDNEKDILAILIYNLAKENFKVKTASNGKDAVKIAAEYLPDVILLDIMMPDQDGVETCRQLREIPELAGSYIIFLTARSEEYSEVAGFDAGADDYIIKPIKPRALISRIQASYRRQQKMDQSEDLIKIQNLEIDKSSYSINIGDQQITLPKKEFELLYFLGSHPNRVFSREELLKEIWGTDIYVLARTVDVHIRKVREKIGNDYISTIKGVGYKFVNEDN